MQLSPTERKEVRALVASQIVTGLREEFDLDQIATVDLATAGQMIALGPKAAAEHLTVIEVGPRTRRVSLADLKAYQQQRKTYPKNWPKA